MELPIKEERIPDGPHQGARVFRFPFKPAEPEVKPEAAPKTEAELLAIIGEAYSQGALATECPWCGRLSFMWRRNSKRGWPYGECRACRAQAHLRSDIGEEGLRRHALAAYGGKHS